MNGHSEHCDQIPQQRRPYLNKRGICRGNALHHTKCHPRHGHGCVPRHSPPFPQHRPMGLMPPLPLSSERKSLGPVPSRQTRTTIQQIWQSVKAQAPGVGFHLGTVTEVQKESATLQFPEDTTHTIKDPSLHRNEKEYTFQNPAIAVRPLLVGRHELLNPRLLRPQEYIPNPPPPRGARRGPH